MTTTVTAWFTLDENKAPDLAGRYPLDEGGSLDHAAHLAIDAAIDEAVITGPPRTTVTVDLLADGGGGLDGWRILVWPPDAPSRLASDVQCVPQVGPLPDTLGILRNAVAVANGLLAGWRQVQALKPQHPRTGELRA